MYLDDSKQFHAEQIEDRAVACKSCRDMRRRHVKKKNGMVTMVIDIFGGLVKSVTQRDSAVSYEQSLNNRGLNTLSERCVQRSDEINL